MIFPPIAAWLAARNQRDKMPASNIPHVTMPIFETVEEARKSLSIEKAYRAAIKKRTDDRIQKAFEREITVA